MKAFHKLVQGELDGIQKKYHDDYGNYEDDEGWTQINIPLLM